MAKRFLVIGSGIVGASIAYHLARAGESVTIVDRGEAGGVATRASWAWINASWGNPEPYFRLRTRSMREWRRLGEDVPGIGVEWLGGLCWDLPPDELDSYAREHERWGYGIRRVDRAGMLAIEPHLASPPALALHVAEEGKVEPLAASKALLEAAAGAGARIAVKCGVKRLVRTADRVTGVETTDGLFAAQEVVLAAGAGTARLAETVGIAVPMSTPPGLLVHSKPAPRLLNGLVMSPEAHVRQTSDGRLVAGADFGGGDPGDDAASAARALFAVMQHMLRGGDKLELDFHTVGYRPTPEDGFPVIGRPVGVQGFYLAVMHSGITLAPAVGLFAARELIKGARDPLLAPYHPDRFLQHEAA